MTWVNFLTLLTILTYHAYRLCHLQKDLTGSPIKIFKIISFKHLSFIVIISAIIPVLEQAIMYTPQQPIPDAICRLTTQLGIVCLAISKLALHLFVAVRSQVATRTTNKLYTIGLLLILSDVLYIIYVVSGIPTILSVQNGVLCQVIDISLPVYIWFAMNDFVIGMYCLLAFVLPLRKYVWLEHQEKMENRTNGDNGGSPTPNASDSELQELTTRIMIFSGIALISTIAVSVISSVVNASGAVLFPIDATVNALCVVLQFKNYERKHCLSCFGLFAPPPTLKSMSSVSQISRLEVPASPTNKVSIIIHERCVNPSKDGGKSMTSKPKLKDNVSLSTSLVQNDAHIEP
eukprot:123230_1